ncbi:MAG: riboflavin kinase, partial [Geminicoccales bacterium]
MLGQDYRFGISRIEPVTWGGEVCSSSRVRAAVESGEVARARDLLGHPFMIEGRVVAGDRRGRELGYPTANLRPPAKRVLWPPAGIYAVRARAPDRGDDWRDAVASLGWRPTFDGRDLVLEVHLFDYEADLYGQWLCCTFIERLRNEERFESVEALRSQMARDCIRARTVLAVTPD